MAATDEGVWIETTTETGEVYYYHNLTLETSWERPEEGVIVSCCAREACCSAAGSPPRAPPDFAAGMPRPAPAAAHVTLGLVLHSCVKMKSKSSMMERRLPRRCWPTVNLS